VTPRAGAAQLYLDLLKACLTRSAFGEAEHRPFEASTTLKSRLFARFQRVLERRAPDVRICRVRPFDIETRRAGRGWPLSAEPMIGPARLNNLQRCIESVLQDNVPGDLIETGVWRGGATIFMRGVLAAYDVTDRIVWVADSFSGVPAPDPQAYPADAGDRLFEYRAFAVSRKTVEENFARYGLLDERVRFLAGWFRDTLPTAPIDRLAVARLDGDLYESTMDALVALYPKPSVGGYLIVDDYGAIPACRQAVEDYRRRHAITEPLVEIDWSGVFWRRER
jgi:O-methyltransferase